MNAHDPDNHRSFSVDLLELLELMSSELLSLELSSELSLLESLELLELESWSTSILSSVSKARGVDAGNHVSMSARGAGSSESSSGKHCNV